VVVRLEGRQVGR